MIVSTLKEILEFFCKDHKGNFILLFKVIYIYIWEKLGRYYYILYFENKYYIN